MSFLLVAACESPSGEVTSHNVRGSWEYFASQTAPALQMEGTLIITEQNGSFFTGTAAITEIDVQGTRRTRAGAVSGSFVGNDVLDFDVHIDAQSRRHVGRIVADSIAGTWSVTSTTPANGSFRARKL